MRVRLTLAAVAIIGSLVRAPLALADNSTADEVRSRQLFDKGHALADEGRWADACPLFLEAHGLHATNGTAISLADCYEKAGAPKRAIPYYEFVLEHSSSDKVRDRVKLASERLAVLRPKAKAPEPASSSPLPPAPDPPSRVPPIVAFGVGGVGLVVGIAFGAAALSDARRAKDGCAGFVCPTANKDFATSANAKAWGSNIGFGVAVVGVAAGVVLLLLSSPPQATGSSAVTSNAATHALSSLTAEGLSF